MKRDLAALASHAFDLMVIGGGVVGACIVRDASRRGLKAALIEQNDFAAAASEAMSHTIHGGIRYLSTGQFGLVRKGLAERAAWMRIAPEYICEQTWLLPLTTGARGFQNRVGVALYQWLSGRKAKVLSRAESLSTEPALEMDGMSGAALYQDFHLAEPHRLVIAVLQDAAAHGAQIANHVAADGLVGLGSGVEGVNAKDRLTGDRFAIQAKQIVNATGPWAQAAAERLVPGQKMVRVTGSKGIHLVTPALSSTHAIAVSGRGEHVFAVPWSGMSLFGTTDDAYAGDLSSVVATDSEIGAFQAKIARLMPAAKPFLDKTIASFAGVRALPNGEGDTYRAAREELIVSHRDDGVPALWTVTGGKWTTARLMAERAVDLTVAQCGRRTGRCDTRNAVIAARHLPTLLSDQLAVAERDEMALTAEDHLRRLGRHALLLDPGLKAEVEGWLARRLNGDNSGTGRSGRLP
ncbi:MAG: glycerol-3-phosphate dehydrogenase/oxidase [Rhizobiaceae bacterium]